MVYLTEEAILTEFWKAKKNQIGVCGDSYRYRAPILRREKGGFN
jgi:hypothetical protein